MRTVIVKTIDRADNRLNHLETTLLRSAMRTIENLKADPFHGDQIRKKQIPPQLRHLPNLWRAEPAQFWRTLYFITSDAEHTYVVIFEICSHKEYDQVFGYK